MTSSEAVPAHFTVGWLARASGVTPSAVRFYEAHGLITSERTGGNQRRFHEPDACRVKIIRVAQRIGLSVAEIKKVLDELPQEPTATDWQRLSRRLVDEATCRMQQLQHVLEDIATDDELCELPGTGAPARDVSH